MHKVELSYQLSANEGRDSLIRNPLIDMLHAVQDAGSISAAARVLGLSYRHVWGALRQAEQSLGQPLIVWDRGQSASLTAFGSKLLWAERQAQARLAPQIEALKADIERAFSTAFDPAAHVLTLHASHDAALSALRTHTAGRGLHLDIRFMGSADAILALNAGRCSVAGFHTADVPGRSSMAAQTYRRLLKPGLHKLIGFAHRSQGLMLAPGNPLSVASLADLVRPGLRYVNRSPGTGTRVLLDDLLSDSGLASNAIHGYNLEEPSHDAVAQAIASGAADAGLGIEAAARGKGLDFLPLARERYFLVCLTASLDEPTVRALREALQDPHWHATLAALPGYSPELGGSGEVLSLKDCLPWWSFSERK
ncbi:MAG: substrate-binding domain-containing protein [Pseudomonadota bacterium]